MASAGHHGGAAVAAAPPDGGPGVLRRYAVALGVPRARASSSSACGSSIRRLHGRPQLLRPDGLRRHSSGSTTTRRSSRRHPPTSIKNSAIWVARRPGDRHGDRARLRRAHRARPLGGRVQDGRLHADGDLALRDRRDLARHVHQGSEPGRRQRRHRRRAELVRRRPARCPRRRRRRPRSPARRSDGFVLHKAVSRGQRRAARADGDPARPTPVERKAGRDAAAEAGRDRPASSGATSSPAAARPASSSRASSACPGVKVEPARLRRQEVRSRRRPATTARSRSTTSPAAATSAASPPRRSRSRSAACRGSARS